MWIELGSVAFSKFFAWSFVCNSSRFKCFSFFLQHLIWNKGRWNWFWLFHLAFLKALSSEMRSWYLLIFWGKKQSDDLFPRSYALFSLISTVLYVPGKGYVLRSNRSLLLRYSWWLSRWDGLQNRKRGSETIVERGIRYPLISYIRSSTVQQAVPADPYLLPHVTCKQPSSKDLKKRKVLLLAIGLVLVLCEPTSQSSGSSNPISQSVLSASGKSYSE